MKHTRHTNLEHMRAHHRTLHNIQYVSTQVVKVRQKNCKSCRPPWHRTCSTASLALTLLHDPLVTALTIQPAWQGTHSMASLAWLSLTGMFGKPQTLPTLALHLLHGPVGINSLTPPAPAHSTAPNQPKQQVMSSNLQQAGEGMSKRLVVKGSEEKTWC